MFILQTYWWHLRPAEYRVRCGYDGSRSRYCCIRGLCLYCRLTGDICGLLSILYTVAVMVADLGIAVAEVYVYIADLLVTSAAC